MFASRVDILRCFNTTAMKNDDEKCKFSNSLLEI